MAATFTHVALHVRDLEACIRFYGDFCGMRVVHERTGENDSERIVWLAEPGCAQEFIFVMLPGGPGRNSLENDFSQFGSALESQAAVDSIAEQTATGLPVLRSLLASLGAQNSSYVKSVFLSV